MFVFFLFCFGRGCFLMKIKPYHINSCKKKKKKSNLFKNCFYYNKIILKHYINKDLISIIRGD